MSELLTAAQMRAIETAAIESGEVTGLELMERAGRGVVEAVFEEWPELAATSHRAVVLCGPGNNGGDGFVVARLLKEWGWEVEVFLYGDADKLPPDARVNYERWGEMGEVADICRVPKTPGNAAIVIDAVFGTGLTRALPDELDSAWKLTLRCSGRGCSTQIVSVDTPSGVCADSGVEIGPSSAFYSDTIVSFHRAKIGHYLNEVPTWRKVVVKSIGLEKWQTSSRFDLPEIRLVDISRNFEWDELSKVAIDHKYDNGHALILSGGPGKTGAARLAARGALRIGAGLVTLGVPGAAQLEVASQVTSIMLRRAGTAEELAGVLEDGRLNAVCLGPGLGVERARELVELTCGGQIAHPTRGVVLDADALTAFEGEPEALFALLHERCVLTPHGGEFRRLFPDIADKLAAPATKGPAFSKVDACREAAARAGCVVLFKGPDTVIAAPDGRCSINSAAYERAAPWLATAGSGDVLAGFITGLLARGFAPMQAAETAAWLHVECALSFGPGLIAEDLPEELPKVLRNLGV
jgi:hydroxyethylthiazole kinase-like uncharacterized protein yjeF